MKNFLHNISQKSKSALAWLWQKTKVAGRFLIDLSIKIWRAILKLCFKIIYEEYELTVWYLKDAVKDKDGNITTTRTSKRYLLKKITKKTPKHIKGKDMEGRLFEIRTVEPFDFQIRKIY
jgi:hypothetical protein